MMDYEISFGPIDNRNPSCGYSIKVINAANGIIWLHVSEHPITGELLDAESCLEVANMYIAPRTGFNRMLINIPVDPRPSGLRIIEACGQRGDDNRLLTARELEDRDSC